MKSGRVRRADTALLMEGAAKVIAVERDERCLPALAEIAAAYPGRLDVISADAMKLDEKSCCQRRPYRRQLAYNVAPRC